MFQLLRSSSLQNIEFRVMKLTHLTVGARKNEEKKEMNAAKYAYTPTNTIQCLNYFSQSPDDI